MVQRQVIAAAAACVVSLTSGYLALQRIRNQVSGGPKVPALVVTRDIGAGATLDSEVLAIVQIPRDYLDARRVQASEKGGIVGATLATSLHAGDGLIWSDVAGGEESSRRLADLIEPGHRAYQVPEDANPLRTRLQAGDRVDVLLSAFDASPLVVENLMVLAVGTPGSGQSGHEGSQGWGVSLSTTPDEAARLVAAERKGKIRLVLRNPSDIALQSNIEQQPAERSPSARSTAAEIDHVR